ncbi:hypothetical protein [Ottowia oryzae]
MAAFICSAAAAGHLGGLVHAVDHLLGHAQLPKAWLDGLRLCLRVAGRQCSSGGPQAHGGVIEFHGLPSELEVAMVGPQGHGGYSSAAL